MGRIKYETQLWENEGLWFLFNYLAVYLIKISIYVFIFEMRHIFDFLTSETLESYEEKRKRRKLLMYFAFIGHTLAILIINTFNYIDLIKDGSKVKDGVIY